MTPLLHQQGKNAEVVAFGADRLPAGKGINKTELKPDAQAALAGVVSCEHLSPDGKFLYFLELEKKQVVKLGTDLASKAIQQDLDGKPIALAVSPNGGALYVAMAGKDGKGRLVTIDAATMKVTANVALGQAVYDLAAGPEGDVVITGEKSVIWASATALARPKRQLNTFGMKYAVRATANGKLAVLCPMARGDFTLRVWPLDGTPGGVINLTKAGPIAPQGGDFDLSSDGSLVLLRSGLLITVPAKWLPK
jgi:hypothetical protein